MVVFGCARLVDFVRGSARLVQLCEVGGFVRGCARLVDFVRGCARLVERGVFLVSFDVAAWLALFYLPCFRFPFGG